MKRILITGAGSYIGTSFEQYLAQWPERYQVDSLSVRGEDWKQADFSPYDAVVHVAGIAHIRETEENKHLYYEVNRDLAVALAEKAKADGVHQYVFLSSMSVYGMDEGAITVATKPHPKTHYGISKLQAEQGMETLQSDDFKIAVLRPPMVYGEGCKGNYQALEKLAKALPVFPNYKNQRSMIHIEKLCAVMKQIIDAGETGLFLPQNEQYVCTCQMVREIAANQGKQMHLLSLLNPFVSLLVKCSAKGKKAFGDLYYE